MCCVPCSCCCKGHAHTRTLTNSHTRRSTVRGWCKGKSKAWLWYHGRGCLAFWRCCGTSKTAAERGKKKKNFLGVCMCLVVLAGRKAIPRFLARFRDFERPDHAPRSPIGTHTCAVVYGRPPCVPRSREREKSPTGAGEKRASDLKKMLLIFLNGTT